MGKPKMDAAALARIKKANTDVRVNPPGVSWIHVFATDSGGGSGGGDASSSGGQPDGGSGEGSGGDSGGGSGGGSNN
ncbi:hypothetical protein CORC01_09792 [Colletotrichum orchidophilum]|uniref:Uncharacterized protein n=1 Tax=Colletotrichum orchidophilum TaxID=1209926 RepID=A0A1G4B0L4_9PEZI|nr:uncharacterized protein CORC01_09792 [Colletotrichum orchidophilum]OHE94873.1 hypothetical protein CORC01_09792 [Colletotrichum orchidophilum]